MTHVLEKPYISVSVNPENIRFLHFTNGGHTRKSIMAAPMFLRIKRSIYTIIITLYWECTIKQEMTKSLYFSSCVGTKSFMYVFIKTCTITNKNMFIFSPWTRNNVLMNLRCELIYNLWYRVPQHDGWRNKLILIYTVLVFIWFNLSALCWLCM